MRPNRRTPTYRRRSEGGRPAAGTMSPLGAHSSRGLGRRPLTAVTRVRIPYAPLLDACLSAGLEAEDEHQSLVDRAELVRIEAPGGPTESLGVEDRSLLDEDARLLTLKADLRPEARRPGACRGRRDENGAEVEEFVRLDDDRENELLVAPARPGRAARAGGRPRRGPSQSESGGASSASCSRMARISSRSRSSAARRRTSSRIAERARGRGRLGRRHSVGKRRREVRTGDSTGIA